jgi:crotonobetainyl-CoA:carnitine CoA-transferase CaiB-like acyl-CoA transferase
MLDAIVTMQMQELSVFTVGGLPQRRTDEPHAHVYIRAPYGVFATKDKFIALAFPPLKKLAAAIEAPELAGMDDEIDTFGRRDEIFAIVRERLRTRSTAEWLKTFAEVDIWAGPVFGYADLVNDPQIAQNGTFVEYEHPTEGRVKTPGFAIDFSRTPSTVARGAPLAGQHSREVLRELGLDDQRIDDLIAARVIAQAL